MTTPIDFGDKQYNYGAGYPTPFSLPEETVCRNFQIPASEDNADWLALFMGLLMTLTEEHNWVQFEGAMDRDAAAAAWQAMIDQAYEDAPNGCATTVPAPYWDDSNGDDADDEAPADDQDWYGVWDGETFLESISYWAVTAFLATGISEGAAIEFITPLRTFRLQMKANPHGAKLLVFMDSNIVQLIDLFSATDEVVSVDVISPGSTLMLVHTGEHNPSATPDANGNYTVDIIRKELTENEVIPSNQRYNADCDCVQFSPDNGTTWIDMPSLDPRHSDAFRYPVLDTSDPQCDAAANMVEWIKDFIDETTAALGDAAEAFQVANIALGFWTLITGGTSVLLDLIVGIGEALTGIGYTALLAAFDEEQYDLLLCCFYCHIDADGQVSAAQLAAVEDQVSTDLNTTAAIVVNLILQLQGEVGLSNAGAIGSETGDCSGCECAWCYDLVLDADSFGFVPLDDPDWGVEGTFSGGWNATTASHAGNGATQLNVYGAFLEANYRKVTCRLNIVLGAQNPDIHHLKVSINGGGSGVVVVESFATGDVEIVLEFNKTGADIDFRVEGIAAFGTTAEVILDPGSINFSSVKMEGIGTNPYGDDNC